MAVAYYGRRKTAPESDIGSLTAGTMRACQFDAATQNLWVYQLGIWAGRYTGSTPTVRLAVYELGLGDQIGYSASGSASTLMSDITGGASIALNVADSTNSPVNTSLKLYSGTRYALAVLPTVAQLGHSMKAASGISALDEHFYYRSGLSQPPPDPFGSATDEGTQGHMTIWAVGDVNVAPDTPSSGLAPSGSISSTTPTITADYKDENAGHSGGTDRGDCLKQYQIQARASGTTTLIWDTTYTAGSAEIAADAVSRAWGGSALTRGTAYQWRIRMSDQFSAWSSWSAWTTFTPANLGFVTLDGSPTGKQDAVAMSFQGRWNHQAATTMKTVQVRILDSAGTVLQTGANYNIADVASAALPGTLFSIAWADTGLSTLAWGRSYKYQIRGYDGTNWSSYSASRSFTTDAAPSIPTGLSPTGGTILTSYPLLSASFTDTDDTTGTGLTGVFRITRPDTSTVDVTPTYNATSGKWEFQTTAVELPAYGVYSWKATGFDGTLYSGEATLLASATWSASSTFDYETGPVLSIDTPVDAATITSAALPVAWTVASGGPQAQFRVLLYADGTSTIAYDSGWVVSATASHTIPAGSYRNATSYDLVVQVKSAVPLTGVSPTINIDIAYTPADTPTNLQVNAVQVGTDPFATAIQVSWDATAYSTPEFVEYTIRRSADGGPDADEIILARLTSPSDTTFVDYHPASGYVYTYSLTQTILTGVDELESDPVTGSASVTLAGTVLVDARNGGTYRANLLNVREREHGRQIDEAIYQPLSGATPTTIRSRQRYWETTLDAAIVADDAGYATAKERRDELDELDQQRATVSYRDGRGIKRWVSIVDLEIADEFTDWYTAGITLRETAWTEGTS